MTEKQKPILLIEETETEGTFEVTEKEQEEKQKIELSDAQVLQMSRMSAQERAEYIHALGKL